VRSGDANFYALTSSSTASDTWNVRSGDANFYALTSSSTASDTSKLA
jgi:hypothetical protein